MNNKYFIYALFVTIISTMACWGSLIKSSSASGRGSSWSSHASGSGGYGGGYSGGGGHK